MARQMRIYDLPDEFPSLRKWLDGFPDEEFLKHIVAVEKLGPTFAGCLLLSDSLWKLRVPIGYGKIANLIFLSHKSGNFLALHGYTSNQGQNEEAELAIARKRMQNLL